MKHLFYFVMIVLLSFSVQAASTEYKLNVTKDDVIVHNQKDWYFVTKSDGHDIYIEKSMIGSKKEIVNFHAYVPYHSPEQIYGVDESVKALYVYGSLHCGRKQLMLSLDMYVDSKNKIVFRNHYEVNTHIVDLNIPKTTRFKILNLVCMEST